MTKRSLKRTQRRTTRLPRLWTRVERLLTTRAAGLPEPLIERLVRQLAIVHSPPVPPGLFDRIEATVTCPVARVVARPGRLFQMIAASLAAASLAAAAWRWQAATPTPPSLMELILLILAGGVILAGLAMLIHRSTLGSGIIGLGALIFAFCLCCTVIGLFVGLVVAGTAFRQAVWSPERLPVVAPGALTGALVRRE